MSNCKKPGWAIWLTMALILLLLYAGSIGPAVALIDRGLVSPKNIARLYYPVLTMATARGGWIDRRTILARYMALFTSHPHVVFANLANWRPGSMAH